MGRRRGSSGHRGRGAGRRRRSHWDEKRRQRDDRERETPLTSDLPPGAGDSSFYGDAPGARAYNDVADYGLDLYGTTPPPASSTPAMSTSSSYYPSSASSSGTTPYIPAPQRPKGLKVGTLDVINDAGEVIESWNIQEKSWDWWALAVQHYTPDADNRIQIHESKCGWDYEAVKFNACTYTATKDYLEAMWGRKLDESDRTWLSKHPLAEDGGIGPAHMATCLAQLVEPYNMRISRIRMRKGLTLYGAAKDWAYVLGCNPIALVDRTTTNEEALVQMGLGGPDADPDMVKAMLADWRFDFGDKPLPGSIVGERGWSNSGSVATGAQGGHARYLAPRGHSGDWVISIQMAPMELVPSYQRPAPNPEYVERRGARYIVLYKIQRPDGRPVGVQRNSWWHAPETVEAAVLRAAEDAERRKTSGSGSGAYNYSSPGSSIGSSYNSVDRRSAATPPSNPAPSTAAPSSTGVPGLGASVGRSWGSGLGSTASGSTASGSAASGAATGTIDRPLFNKSTCGKCDTQVLIVDMDEGDVCVDCAAEAWLDYECPHCKVKFTSYKWPAFKGAAVGNSEVLEFTCPAVSCRGLITAHIPTDADPNFRAYGLALTRSVLAKATDARLGGNTTTPTTPTTPRAATTAILDSVDRKLASIRETLDAVAPGLRTAGSSASPTPADTLAPTTPTTPTAPGAESLDTIIQGTATESVGDATQADGAPGA